MKSKLSMTIMNFLILISATGCSGGIGPVMSESRFVEWLVAVYAILFGGF